MPPPAPQGQQNDNSMGFLWIIAGLFLLVYGIWYAFHGPIVAFIFQIRLAEIALISEFTHGLSPITQEIHTLVPSQVSFSQLDFISSKVGEYLRYPIIPILLIFSFIIYKKNPTSRFKRTFDMTKFRDQEKELWYQIEPVTKLNLIKQDISKGPWAMSLTPMEFVKHNDLIDHVKSEAPLGRGTKRTAKLKRADVNRVFALQLGRHWTGPDALSLPVQALFAVFAARMNHDTDNAIALLEQIARSASGNNLNFSGTKALLNKHINTRIVQDIMQSHAYELTVMASMIQNSRADGVMACVDFIWLKPINRRLWFMLNSIGRQTAFAEVAGPFAHWLSEKALGRRIVVPMIEEATRALEGAMEDIIYHPDEEGD